MWELGWPALSVLLVSGLFIGFSKTGITTLGMMIVIVMTLAFPARESVGIVLPVLIVGDLIAVVYYRRSVIWKHLFSLIPWVLAGIVAGYFVLRYTDGGQLTFLRAADLFNGNDHFKLTHSARYKGSLETAVDGTRTEVACFYRVHGRDGRLHDDDRQRGRRHHGNVLDV